MTSAELILPIRAELGEGMTLFPDGKGDFSSSRLKEIKHLHKWAEHLMRFHDGRFESRGTGGSNS
ncbi:MAG: hypothetical protein RLZZ99_823 [Actinomycetota bacterium]